MVTDQNYSSDSTPTKQKVIRYTEKLAQTLGLNEQNAERVKRLERDVGSLEDELKNLDEYVVEDLDKCVKRETVVNIIHEIVPSLIGKKGSRGAVHRGNSFYSSESSEGSDSFTLSETSSTELSSSDTSSSSGSSSSETSSSESSSSESSSSETSSSESSSSDSDIDEMATSG
ncbi:hypothetical protein C1645_836336 [Glomus cerebriforme]|uniref:Uncharacterized protein n=1 Tax=Glomus cerebriforme TaxID=658196 RepID=A0A397S626_9GLOM|nr:hypothetical protein C1645_836336 [Glomus cerebriforme]